MPTNIRPPAHEGPEPLPEGIQEPDWKIDPIHDLEQAIVTIAGVQRRAWDATRETQTIQGDQHLKIETLAIALAAQVEFAIAVRADIVTRTGRAAEAAITRAMEGIQDNLKSVAETTAAFLDEDRAKLEAMQAQIDRNTATLEGLTE